MQYNLLSLKNNALQTYRGRLFLILKKDNKQVVVFKGMKQEKSKSCFGGFLDSKEITLKVKHLQKVVIGQIPNNQVHLSCMEHLKNQSVSELKWISLLSDNSKQGDLHLYRKDNATLTNSLYILAESYVLSTILST